MIYYKTFMTTTDILEHCIRTYGYWALLIGTFLEGETILLLGGLSASLGYLDLSMVMIIAFIGSFSGDQAYFYIGRSKGRTILAKFPRLQQKVEKVHHFSEKYHDAIMLGFRFVYGIRIMTPFVLGLSNRIQARRFAIFNAAGAVLWAVGVAGGGYLFGQAVELFLTDVKKYQIIVMALAACAGICFWLIHKYRTKKLT